MDSIAETHILQIANELYASAHRFLVTRDLNEAKKYLRERYADAKEARFGILASSKDKWLLNFGVDNSLPSLVDVPEGPLTAYSVEKLDYSSRHYPPPENRLLRKFYKRCKLNE